MGLRLQNLLATHRTVQGFMDDESARLLVLETLGQVEVGVRAMGWRLLISTSPKAHIRVHVLTADGFEITAEGPSILACFLEPSTAQRIHDHYKAAVSERLREG